MHACTMTITIGMWGICRCGRFREAQSLSLLTMMEADH